MLSSFRLFLLSRFLNGLFCGGNMIVNAVFIFEFVTTRRRPVEAAMFSTGWALGEPMPCAQIRKNIVEIKNLEIIHSAAFYLFQEFFSCPLLLICSPSGVRCT